MRFDVTAIWLGGETQGWGASAPLELTVLQLYTNRRSKEKVEAGAFDGAEWFVAKALELPDGLGFM